MNKLLTAFLVMMSASLGAQGAGLDCTSTVSQGSKKVLIDLSGTNLSRLAFGPCNGPPPTCRPIEFNSNLRAALDHLNRPLGQYYGENGRQTMNVLLNGFVGSSASGVAQVVLGSVGRPVNLNVTCKTSP